ncbi:polymeric immunoglobulin receptor-like isoform X2 [Paramisgurnus dabryanus]|uniref:polymeric immunoglobulin receptor-like isoform X2 n=1 Tax=Paramisgurnus dabryanus TaxID=90735 RepID=UPI003CCF8D93
MVAYGKAALLYTIIWFCLILGTECFGDEYSNTIRRLSVKSGGSVTIPCYYDRKYTQQKKYWYSETDKSYTNTTAGDVTVIDDPAQSLFTVTMRNLTGQHNGTYYCIVKTVEQPGDMTTTDDIYLHVQSDPDVSVMSSSVTVDEGGNISVQCLYSTKFKDKTNKQWCRYKDKRCYTSQDASVKISDDGNKSFTVVMSGLMKSDSGWYYCSVGDKPPSLEYLQVPFQLTVTGAATPDTTEGIKIAVWQWLPVSAVFLLLMILVGVFIWKWKRRSEEDKKHIKMRNDCVVTDTVTSTPEDVVIYSTINDENPDNKMSPSDSNIETTYCLVEDPSGHKAVPEDGTIYSFVEPHDQNPEEQ